MTVVVASKVMVDLGTKMIANMVLLSYPSHLMLSGS